MLRALVFLLELSSKKVCLLHREKESNVQETRGLMLYPVPLLLIRIHFSTRCLKSPTEGTNTDCSIHRIQTAVFCYHDSNTQETVPGFTL